MPWYKYTAEVFCETPPDEVTKDFDEEVRGDLLSADRISQVTNTSWYYIPVTEEDDRNA